jgi:hypothetical protein
VIFPEFYCVQKPASTFGIILAMSERKKIHLEIGVGAYPFPVNPTMIDSRDGRTLERNFTGNSVYVGIDSYPDPNRYWFNFLAGEEPFAPLTSRQKQLFINNLSQAKSEFSQKKPNENINFLLADAHNLPFAPESVSEVFLSNVFGSQLLDESLGEILTNVSRVLIKDGAVVIRETSTPHWSFPDALPSLLAEYGFKAEEFAKYGTKKYDELLGKYGATYEDLDEETFKSDMYFCIAKKILNPL